jgi:serine/threonine-protein kinase
MNSIPSKPNWQPFSRELRRLSWSSESTPLYGTLSVAEVYLGLGSTPDALDWLDKAYRKRPYGLVFLGVDPLWKPLRGEPRFQELLRKIGLPP